ncbi:MAG: DUF2905 domain-containing protein [Solirubrobacteraceae bacterium]|jgi:hypothetical protein
MEAAAKALIAIAAVVGVLGLALLAAAKLGLHRLPGDIVVRRGNFRLYAPVGLMIALSVILTIVLNLISRR